MVTRNRNRRHGSCTAGIGSALPETGQGPKTGRSGAHRAAELAQQLEFLNEESEAAFLKAVDAIEAEFETVKAANKRNA